MLFHVFLVGLLLTVCHVGSISGFNVGRFLQASFYVGSTVSRFYADFILMRFLNSVLGPGFHPNV